MKSKKLLSVLVTLSIVATSSIAFNSVQASEINKATNTQKITYAQKSLTSNSTNYSVYSSLNYNALQDIWAWHRESTTSTELGNHIVSKGYANKTVAYNMAATIVLSGYRALGAQDIAGNGVLFLKADDSNQYTMIPNYPVLKTTYTSYFYLSQTNVNTIRNYIRSYNGSTFTLRDFLLNNNICYDSSTAYNVAQAIGPYDSDDLQDLNNDGVWILKSNNSGTRYIVAPTPKYIASSITR